MLTHPFRPLGRLCANRKSIARSEHFSVLQNPHVPHAAVNVQPTGVGVIPSDQCPEAFGLRRRRIGATSATARNATSVRWLALTPIRFNAKLRHGTRLLVYVVSKRIAPGMADREQSRRHGRTAQNTQDCAVALSTTACKSCPPITKIGLASAASWFRVGKRPSYQFNLNTSCPSRPPGSNVLFGSR